MINVLQRLAEIDANSPAVDKSITQVQAMGLAGDTAITDVMPTTSDLRALAGMKESKKPEGQTLTECGGMPTMGAPMPSMIPSSINMSAPTSGDLVNMLRGIMDLAGTDAPTAVVPPSIPDTLIGHEPLVAEPEHSVAHSLPVELPTEEPTVTGPTFGDEGSDEGGDDEIMDLIKKIRTGDPVKITTDMPVKVSSDEPIKGTTDKLNKVSDSGEEEEGYDNTPASSQPKKAYDPNDFAQVVNKVRDLDYTPPGSGSNPLPQHDKEKDDEEEKKKESYQSFESQLFDEYKKFVNEGMKVGDKKKSSTGGTIEKTKTGVKHTAGNNYGAEKQPWDEKGKKSKKIPTILDKDDDVDEGKKAGKL